MLTMNGQGHMPTFPLATPSPTVSNGQGTEDGVDISLDSRPADARHSSMSMLYGDPQTLLQTQQPSPPQPHHVVGQNIPPDQAWHNSFLPWSVVNPPLTGHEPLNDHRRQSLPPVHGPCVCQTSPVTISDPGTSILHLAVSKGNCEVLKMLLQDDEIYIDEKDNAGFTPLQRAVMMGNADMVAVLLEHGADLVSRD